MKEFYSEAGGRHVYNTDFKNLQELAMAFSQIFEGCDNFIISGCDVGSTLVGDDYAIMVEKGYAYINGKIVVVEESVLDVNAGYENLYIQCYRREGTSIPYADESSHPQYYEYYAKALTTTTPDSTYGYIAYNTTDSKFPDMRSAFFGKYAVTKNIGEQIIDILTVSQKLSVTQKMIARQGVQLNTATKGLFDQGHGTGLRNGDYELVINNGEIIVYNNGSKLFSITGSGSTSLNVNNAQLTESGHDNDYVPVGTIIMWGGDISQKPETYILCDGSEYTSTDYPKLAKALGTQGQPYYALNQSGDTFQFKVPDLKSRFIVGYDPSDNDYKAIGGTGGEKTHQLTVAELPSHSHTYNRTLSSSIAAGGLSSSSVTANSSTTSSIQTDTGSVGGGQAHENRPPYYVLAYLIKAK